MKKIKFILFLLFINVNLNAQNNSTIAIVEYQTTLNLGLPAQNTSKLFFNENKSCYYEGKYEVSGMPTETKIVTNKDITEKIIKYYVNKHEQKLFKEELINNELYLIEENLPKIEWNLSFKEEDSILGQLCNRAEAHFRGRTYTAWYAPSIPVNYGPWKLQGLPGLILKVYDDLNQVKFSAISFEYVKAEKSLKKLELSSNYFKTITLKEYVTLTDNNENDELKKIMASMPRDTKIGNIKINKERTSKIEMIYEWEKD